MGGGAGGMSNFVMVCAVLLWYERFRSGMDSYDPTRLAIDCYKFYNTLENRFVSAGYQTTEGFRYPDFEKPQFQWFFFWKLMVDTGPGRVF